MAGALRLIYPHDAIWKPPVITMSGLEGVGLDEFWGTVTKHRRCSPKRDSRGEASQQQVDWTWTMVNDQLLRRLSSNDRVRAIRADVEQSVRDGSLTAALAAGRILDAFDGSN